MSGTLSQDEINALLGGDSPAPEADDPEAKSRAAEAGADYDIHSELEEVESGLTPDQKDVLGEIGNISMGTSATTLFALINQKVMITTPEVKVIRWKQLSKIYKRPCIGVRVSYTHGLRGSNVLVLKQRDVKIITDLMMGGDGGIPEDFTIDELDMSAISEAMNQMIGSASTSLSSVIGGKIDINTPDAFVLDFNDDKLFEDAGFEPDEEIVCVFFRMEIGSLIDSDIVQVLPKEFALQLVDKIEGGYGGSAADQASGKAFGQAAPRGGQGQATYAPPERQPYPPSGQYQPYPADSGAGGPSAQPEPYPPYPPQYQAPMNQPGNRPVNVQAAQFQNFDARDVMQEKENIGIIMDVPLDVTVELGRTRKKIRDILEFAPGTIIELDKLAGEPIDVLVNGKFTAKGEVVVIDENFGIRITEISRAESVV